MVSHVPAQLTASTMGLVSGIGYCGCIAVGRGGLFGAGTLYTIVGGRVSLVVDHVVPCIRRVV